MEQHLNAFYDDHDFLIRSRRDISVLTLDMLYATLTPGRSSAIFIQHGAHRSTHTQWGRNGLVLGLDALRMEGSIRHHTDRVGSSCAIGRTSDRERLVYHAAGWVEESFPHNAILDISEIVEALDEFMETARRPSNFSWLYLPERRPAPGLASRHSTPSEPKASNVH